MLRDNGTWWDALAPLDAENFLNGEVEGQTHPARLYVKKWLEGLKLKKKPTFLDVACGRAVDYQNISGLVEYNGVDKTNILLETAKKNCPDATFHYGQITELPFKEKSFDIVQARAIFEHLAGLPEVEQGIKECFRVAKNWLILGFYLPLSSKESMNYNGMFHENTYSKESIDVFVKELGAKDARYENAEGYSFYFIQK